MSNWISTGDGLFSELPHPARPDRVIVRCRVREDAERLMQRLGAGIVVESPDDDAGTAILLPKVAWTVYLATASEDDARDDSGDTLLSPV